MRKIALFVSIIFLWQTQVKGQNTVGAVKDSVVRVDSLPYMKYPTLPAFNILHMDSVTIFNTFNIPSGKVVALMLFDPECRHCKDLTKKIIAGMDSLKDIQFYMISPTHNMPGLRKFYEDFKLAEFSNIKLVGRDYEFFFHEYYAVKYVPDIALYDKNKNLIKLFEGGTTVKELYKYSHER